MNNLDIALDTCEEWAEENEMTINRKKSKILFMEGQMKYNPWELNQNKEYRGYGSLTIQVTWSHNTKR